MVPLLLASVLVASPLELVRVPTSTTPWGCEVFETVAAYASADPKVWVERTPGDADLVEGGRTLRVRRAKRTEEVALDPDAPALEQLGAPLRRVFGGHARPWEVAPSGAALRAACRGEAQAWDLIGTSITPTILSSRVPAPNWSGPTGDWVEAVLALRQGQVRTTALSRMTQRVDEGLVFPSWRSSRPHPGASLAGWSEGRLLLFEDGAFYRIDAATGAISLAEQVGKAEASYVSVGRHRVLVRQEDVLVNGRPSVLHAPHPEVATDGYRVFIANADILRSVDPRTSETLWEAELSRASVAGPVFAAGAVVVAEEDALTAFAAGTGAPLWRTALPNDLSAPPAASSAVIWVLTGARRMQGVEAASGRLTVRDLQMERPSWPPVSGRERIFLLEGETRRGLVSVDEAGDKTRLDALASAPLIRNESTGGLIYRSGKGLVGRSRVGDEQWKLSISEAPFAVETHRGLGLALHAAGLTWFDLRTGKALAEVPMYERPVQAMLSSEGAVVRADSLLGAPPPTDASRAHLWTFAHLVYGEASRQSGARTRAAAEAEQIIARAPDDLRAHLLLARSRPELSTWLEVLRLAPLGARVRGEAMASVTGLVAHRARRPQDQGIVGGEGATWTVVTSTGAWRLAPGGRNLGSAPPPPGLRLRREKPPDAPIRFGAWQSTDAYGRPVRSDSWAVGERDGAWWLVGPGRDRPLRLLRSSGTEVHPLEGGFAIVTDRRVYGVIAEQGRLVGPISASSAPISASSAADALILRTAPDRIEVLRPMSVRRGAVYTFGAPIRDWAANASGIAVMTEHHIAILEL